MKDNSIPLNDIKFTTVATVHKNWLEKATTVEDAKQELDYIYFQSMGSTKVENGGLLLLMELEINTILTSA